MPTMTPTPERWARLSDLLGDALERASAERAAYLREVCADDPTLVAEVERLLAAHEAAESSQRFASGVFDLAPAALAEAAPLPHIGPYRLAREIGRGGMGTVWLAERADGLFEQRVAVKLMRAGVLAEDQHRRFRAERRILAGLDHPHIARLLDGGVTEATFGAGQPYLVMEYVEGVPITTYCRERDLPLADRLALFREVCHAVAYAHQNLVVHRDLKPSNIFVAESLPQTGSGDADGKPGPSSPIVKLLDFGIAKLLADDEEDEATLATRTGQALMTPEYAAPEQVRGDTITTATDVYALGVVLYELLVGHRPYAIEDRSATAVERAVLETEPLKPSAALKATTRPGAAQATGPTSTTERRARRLRGDLDTIVLKALRKEPERRYRSAAELADDLRRHAEGLPVTAQPDTTSYRLRKFVQRHRTGFAASVALLVALLLGLAGTLWQARVAQAEAARAQAVNGFLQDMLAAADPIGGRGRDITVAEVLDEASQDVATRFGADPPVEGAVRLTLGVTYRGLGDYATADSQLTRALALTEAAYGSRHRETAEALSQLGQLRMEVTRFDSADSLLTHALALRRSLRGVPSDDLARSLLNVGTVALQLGDIDRAFALTEEALLLSERFSTPQTTEHRDLRNNIRYTLAIAHYDRGTYRDADSLLTLIETEVVGWADDEANRGRPPFYLGGVQSIHAWVKDYLGERDAILPLLHASFATRRALHGEEHPHMAVIHNDLAYYHQYLGNDYALAEGHYQTSLRLMRAGGDEVLYELPITMQNLAVLYRATGRYDEALPLLTEALRLQREAVGDEHYQVASILAHIARIHHLQGDLPRAIATHEEALAMRERTLGVHTSTAISHQALGEVLHDAGRYDDAETQHRSAVAVQTEALGPAHPDTAEAEVLLAETLIARGEPAEARALLAHALPILDAHYDGDYSVLDRGRALEVQLDE